MTKKFVVAGALLGAAAVWFFMAGPDRGKSGESFQSTAQESAPQAGAVKTLPAPKLETAKTLPGPARPGAGPQAEDTARADTSRGARPEDPRRPAAQEQYSGKLLTQTIIPAEDLIRDQEGKIPEKDRVELQKADKVAVLTPPAGKKILAFKDLKTENCGLLSEVRSPMTLSIASDGGVESAEYLRGNGEEIPAGIKNCRFKASGEFKGQAFMTVYVPEK